MDQHRDISVCAHAACWSILRHYSVRYSMYREQHTHDITMLAHEFDPGGFIPSRGLVLSQAERIFQAAGTFPVIVPRDCTNSTDLSFYRQLIAYVESGFPLFAAMHKKGHAMAVVGFDWHSSANTKPSGMQYAWDRVRELGVVDDNHLPYLTIPVSGGAYAASDIDSFIVALPEKIFYPAEAFDELVPRLYEFEYLNLPPVDNAVTRYFVTTASAFRRFVREHESEFDPKLLAAVMELPFAQFLWIAEISTHEQWAVRQVTARAVIDATASLTEEYPFWILHDRRQAVIFGRGAIPSGSAGQPGLPFEMGLLDLAVTGLNGYSRMETNLRATHAKR